MLEPASIRNPSEGQPSPGVPFTPETKCHILNLAGGLGARIIQTGFVRSLAKLDSTLPVVVVDQTNAVGPLVAASHPNTLSILPSNSGHYPVEPPILRFNDGPEHPMFIPEVREALAEYEMDGEFDLHRLWSNNADRSYGVDYGNALTKAIHKHKLRDHAKSFIGYLYGAAADLKWDGGLPLLTRTETNPQIEDFIRAQTKPIVLCHFGMDKQHQEMTNVVNYRVHKVWSLRRWAKVAEELSDQYTFVQVYHAPKNPTVPGFVSLQVDGISSILQLLEACEFYLSIDNFLPHLAASLPKSGVVLWGSVSPYVWGWKHNVNIWKKHSCPDIACWRPGGFDGNSKGQTFLCSHYSCMHALEVSDVLEGIDKLMDLDAERPNKLRVGDNVSFS